MAIASKIKTRVPKISERYLKGNLQSKAIFSFFSGAGFLDLGFENAGYETAFVNEYHKPFLDAYKHSRKVLKMVEPKYGYNSDDIKDLLKTEKAIELGKIIKKAKNTYDVVGFVGGPPCPDFSIGGKNKGKEGKNGVLSSVYIEIITKHLPDFFLFENVKGLWSTKRHREFYDSLKQRLENSGYILTDKLINSIEYGVAQDRNRIILIGFHKKFLTKQGKKHDLSSFPWNVGKENDRLVLKDKWPETNQFRDGSNSKIPANVNKKLTISYWFEKNKVETHPNSSDFFKPQAAFSKFKTIAEGDVSKKSFKRLHRWRYSPTAAYGNNEVHIHPFKPRRISVAEALAIQSLPKEYELPKDMTLSNKFKAVGNGVPYLAAKGVADAIKHFLV